MRLAKVAMPFRESYFEATGINVTKYKYKNYFYAEVRLDEDHNAPDPSPSELEIFALFVSVLMNTTNVYSGTPVSKLVKDFSAYEPFVAPLVRQKVNTFEKLMNLLYEDVTFLGGFVPMYRGKNEYRSVDISLVSFLIRNRYLLNPSSLPTPKSGTKIFVHLPASFKNVLEFRNEALVTSVFGIETHYFSIDSIYATYWNLEDPYLLKMSYNGMYEGAKTNLSIEMRIEKLEDALLFPHLTPLVIPIDSKVVSPVKTYLYTEAPGYEYGVPGRFLTNTYKEKSKASIRTFLDEHVNVNKLSSKAVSPTFIKKQKDQVRSLYWRLYHNTFRRPFAVLMDEAVHGMWKLDR